ncbi:hypothetical protein CHU93_00630 [Sandarakinorhabdus cyanobacteriorum]|uniref:Uncharacterized protein n=1 Tax=Sandarakinorhabdus cyanobacteriorum TaxID=1981098 RepID=A0A255Z8K0_9SPHN|nr:hypothetical protein CHU93_00630 [Sandarakinorhabdus cyanobacteriorum]
MGDPRFVNHPAETDACIVSIDDEPIDRADRSGIRQVETGVKLGMRQFGNTIPDRQSTCRHHAGTLDDHPMVAATVEGVTPDIDIGEVARA